MTTLPKPSPTPLPLRNEPVTLRPAPSANGAPVASETTTTPPTRRGGASLLWLIIGFLVIAALGYAIYAGIHGRTQAETRLTDETQTAAVPSVVVVHPKP